MTLIYLEGPDCAGKTTLARKLAASSAARNRRPVILHDTYSKDQWRHSSRILGVALRRHYAGQDVIMDRGWIGNDLYNGIYRPTQPVQPWPRWHHGLMEAAGALTVFCLPEPARYRERVRANKDRGEMYDYRTFEVQHEAYMTIFFGQPHQGLTTLIGYDALLANSGGMLAPRQTVRYYADTVGSEADADADRLWSFATDLEGLEREAQGDLLWGRALHSGAICDSEERVLLIGERSNDPEGPMPHPFFGNTSSSRYLARALDAAGLRQDHLAMVNAWDPDGGRTGLLNCLKHQWKKVLCLGDTARSGFLQLHRLEQSHGHVPHPQYWNRFRHNDIDDYVAQIKECLAR